MSTPAAALSLCDRAVLLVLTDLLPPDSPRELTVPQIAGAGGFQPRRVTASLAALERAGLIQQQHAGPGSRPSILRPSIPLPAVPSDAPPPQTPLPHAEKPPCRSVTDALCDVFRSHPPDTVLTTSTRELAVAIGRPDSGQIRTILGRLAQAGLVERLPGRDLRLRLCGPFPTSEGDAAPASEEAQPVLTLVRTALRGQPLGVELSITVKELATTIRRCQMSVVRALRTLETEGVLRRTVVGRRTGLILLAPLEAPEPPSAPAPRPAAPPPALPTAQQRTPHAALWQHLRASEQHRTPIDWLLSGVTITVLADTTVVTCVDAARTSFARARSRTLSSALRALSLPHTLVIAQAPASLAPALPPGALEAALASTSVDALLETLRPLPTTTEAEARALLAQVQAGQAAQERWEALGQPSSEIGAALTLAIAAGHTAWEWLILSHLRLVVRAARRYPSARVSLEERVQAGLLGLMQAVARSDGRLTVSFVLFAYRVARAAVRAALQSDQPFRPTTSGHRVARAQRELQAELGHAPSAEEIAGHTRMHPSTVVAVFGVQGGIVSLDAPLRADEPGTLAEVVADTQTLTPEDLLLAREAAQERRRALGGALAALDPDARRVLALRFGLEGEARGVTEVARAMGWSVPRVQRIEAGALTALRERMEGWAGEVPRPAAR